LIFSRRRLLAVLFVGLLVSIGLSGVATAAEPKKADAVTLKAAYVFNFIRFTEWPEAPEPAPSKGLVLQVVGDDDLYEVLHSLAHREAARSVGLSVDTCTADACLAEADAVFLGQSSAGYESTLQALKGLPVLTISDVPGFASHGGMIEIRYQDKKLTFIVNRDAVARAGLYISAQLLQLGEVVGE